MVTEESTWLNPYNSEWEKDGVGGLNREIRGTKLCLLKAWKPK